MAMAIAIAKWQKVHGDNLIALNGT